MAVKIFNGGFSRKKGRPHPESKDGHQRNPEHRLISEIDNPSFIRSCILGQKATSNNVLAGVIITYVICRIKEAVAYSKNTSKKKTCDNLE